MRRSIPARSFNNGQIADLRKDFALTFEGIPMEEITSEGIYNWARTTGAVYNALEAHITWCLKRWAKRGIYSLRPRYKTAMFESSHKQVLPCRIEGFLYPVIPKEITYRMGGVLYKASEALYEDIFTEFRVQYITKDWKLKGA